MGKEQKDDEVVLVTGKDIFCERLESFIKIKNFWMVGSI